MQRPCASTWRAVPSRVEHLPTQDVHESVSTPEPIAPVKSVQVREALSNAHCVCGDSLTAGWLQELGQKCLGCGRCRFEESQYRHSLNRFNSLGLKLAACLSE